MVKSGVKYLDYDIIYPDVLSQQAEPAVAHDSEPKITHGQAVIAQFVLPQIYDLTEEYGVLFGKIGDIDLFIGVFLQTIRVSFVGRLIESVAHLVQHLHVDLSKVLGLPLLREFQLNLIRDKVDSLLVRVVRVVRVSVALLQILVVAITQRALRVDTVHKLPFLQRDLVSQIYDVRALLQVKLALKVLDQRRRRYARLAERKGPSLSAMGVNLRSHNFFYN